MRVGGLFSGVGGIELGFIQAGFDVVWANEFDKNACITYRLNFPKHNLIEDDIWNVILNNFKQRNKIVFFSFCQLNVDQYQFKQLSICGFYNKSLLSLLNFSKIFNKIFKYSV